MVATFPPNEPPKSPLGSEPPTSPPTFDTFDQPDLTNEQETPAPDPLAGAFEGELVEHPRKLLVNPRAYVAAMVAVGGLVLAVALQRPMLIALAAPMLLALGLAAVAPPWASLNIRLFASDTRAVEGDVLTFLVELTATGSADLVDVELEMPSHFDAGAPMRSIVSVTPGLAHVMEIPVTLADFGVATPESITVTTHGPFGFFQQRQRFNVDLPVRILLSAEQTRTLLSPRRYRNSAGSHLSAQRGEGCEIADLRPYRPGDRLKNINRRVSQRRGDLWITERHPDRSSDLVLMFDNSDWFRESDEETLRRAVKAVISLSGLHLRSHDRVGVLQFGRKVRWVAPRLGRFQPQRIVDSLLELRASIRVPREHDPGSGASTLPPNAVMVAFTPLINRSVRSSLIRYRRHGLTVNVVELLPPSIWATPTDYDDLQAMRIFRLHHEVIRNELRDLGIPVIPWPAEVPVEQLVRQVDILTKNRRGAVGL